LQSEGEIAAVIIFNLLDSISEIEFFSLLELDWPSNLSCSISKCYF